MKTSHVHVWGSKGRAPRPGDYCLACPAEYTRRAAGYHADTYKPRTKPHAITPKPREDAA